MLPQQPNPSSRNIEIGQLGYELIPSIGDVQINKTTLSFNLPKKIKNNVLVFGLGYTNFNSVFKSVSENRQFDNFSNLHNIRLNVVFMKPLSNSWSLRSVFVPSLSTNFSGKLTSEDIVFNSFTTFNKQWRKDYKLTSLSFGIAFGTQFGAPQLFPVLSYSKVVNKNLSYTLGLPFTGLFYTLNNQNAIGLKISPQGFFANNSGFLKLDNSDDFLKTPSCNIMHLTYL